MEISEEQNMAVQTARHVDPALLERWQQLARHRGGKCRVGNLGLLKAGKSSLANALADVLDDRLFAVGVNRTTTRTQAHDLGDFVLLDTPGLDCSQNDTRETLGQLESFDIILFVHNLNVSELDAYAMRLLQSQLTSARKKEEFMRKTFWVLTKMDECGAENGKILRKKIVAQIMSVCGQPPPAGQIFCVASDCYKKGMKESKKLLVEMSQIVPLREALRATARQQQAAQAAARKEQQAELARAILAGLQSQWNSKRERQRQDAEELTLLRQRFDKRLDSLRHTIQFNLKKIQEN